ncbi:MAG: hypothetical protein ACI4WS_06845 [Oscillospiraceae bacterium]
MIQALKRFYSSFGDRGVMFVMFAVSVVAHSLLAMCMELPAVNPDEIGVASIAAFYSGKDWSALMGQVGYYYGYVQALFYTPLFLFFNNSYALYKACLVMNGVLISFIPLIAYDIATRLGINSVWKKVVISFCCGSYITYIAHSKFIWNEAICSLLPWVLLWVMFMSMNTKKAGAKVMWSIAAGLLCAVCYGAHSRLIAVVIALVLTVLIARICMNRRIFLLPVFFPALAGGFVGEYFCRKAIQQAVWNGKASGNTMEAELDRVLGLFEEGGFNRFISTLFGHLYTFMTSTVGIGAIAFVVLFLLVVTRIREWNSNRKCTLVDGVKVYEPSSKHIYSGRLTILGIYAFFAVGGSMLLSVLFKFNSGQIDEIKDLTMFGRYTDNTAPLVILLVLIFLFRYGLNLKHIGWAAGVYAYVCFGFCTVSWKMVSSAKGYRESPVLGLMPWRISEDYTRTFTADSFIIMTSVTFAVLALMAVFTACTRKSRTALVSGLFGCLFMYSTIFAGTVYLPQRAEENLVKTEPAKQVSTLLYNEEASPTIVAFGIGSRSSGLIQFLNLNTNVAIIRKEKNIPENCIIIADEEKQLTLDPDSYDYIGTEGGLSVYAYGETARDYMKYKRSADTTDSGENSETAHADGFSG